MIININNNNIVISKISLAAFCADDQIVIIVGAKYKPREIGLVLLFILK
jgi:hypothetical protein